MKSSKTIPAGLLIILLISFVAYLPVLKCGFIYLDDDRHLLENTAVRALDFDHIKQMFTMTVNNIYLPLTLLSFAIEYHFFKYSPFIYHFVNLLLHLGVTGLVYYFALQVGLPLRAAFLAGLLFGIHPMHVESVAWVTERKDVLYAFFYMLSLSFYWKYLSGSKTKNFVLSLLFGLLSILAKPMALSLPLVLFLIDWLKKRPLTRLVILDKIPYFLYIIPISWITYSLNSRIPGENLISGAATWIWTSIFYLHKFILPLVLVPVYSLPQPVSFWNPHYFGAVGLWGLFILFVSIYRKERWIWFAVGFYFLSMFFLFRYDSFADRNIVADRFMYLPCLGICFLFGYYVDQLYGKIKNKDVLSFILILVILFLGTKTFAQTKLWGDNIAFWSHVIKYYPNNALALGNRGEAYKDINRLDLAMADFNKSISADPNYPESYNSRGQLLAQNGHTKEALKDFEKAITLNPRFDEAYSNMGIVYAIEKDFQKSLFYFKKALDIDPNNIHAQENLKILTSAKNDAPRNKK